MLETSADITIVNEVNHDPDDAIKETLRQKVFKHYNIEDAKIPGENIIRCSMIIKKGVLYERIDTTEDKVNPTVAIKLKTDNNEYTAVVGIYREWKKTWRGCSKQ